MPFVASHNVNKKLYEYIVGAPNKSIMTTRWSYLQPLAAKYGDDKLKVAFQDNITGAWSKWSPFPGIPGMLLNKSSLMPAIDVHRSVFENEIVIESDYPTYEENCEASRIIGTILERKGFVPHYYFSGNKSIHIHVFIDWKAILGTQAMMRESIKPHFKRDFIRWLRALMIRCWDTGVRNFDEDLIRATHLIRCELSKNKRGFKTFLGYTYKDLAPVPIICNEDNGIYPRLAEMRLSSPNQAYQLVEEFLTYDSALERKKRSKRKIRALSRFIKKKPEELRGCIKIIMSDEFKKAGDGTQRGMFILANELKRVFGKEQAEIILHDWNQRMGNPVSESDMRYRIKMKNYTLTCDYIHSFLKGVGIDASEKCKDKL